MKPEEFTNYFIRKNYINSQEGTKNLLNFLADEVALSDKKRKLPESVIKALNLPDSVKTMHDYRSMFDGLYNRVYEFCVISLCSDIEFMFKEAYKHLEIEKSCGCTDRGFYQRIDNVIKNLEKNGFEFKSVEEELKTLKLAFNVRHIAIHNFGLIDKDFIEKTDKDFIKKIGISGIEIEKRFPLSGEFCKKMFEEYVKFLKCFDSQIKNLD